MVRPVVSLDGSGTANETYRLVRRLRQSPTGDLFEGAHPRLPGRYAIKILNRAALDHPQVLAAYRAEIEATIALRHPNIVQVVELGAMPDGTPFVVMELLEGIPLDQQLARGPMSPLDAANLIRSLAGALQSAHSHGLIHRSLAPRRAFLAAVEGHEAGFPKLTGFGAWRLRAALAAATGAGTANDVRYLSPEQAMGKHDQVDARSDLFSLAAIAYRMLAGVDPFRGDDAITVLYQVVHEQPRSLADAGLIEARLDAVLQAGLAKSRDARYESVMAFSRAFVEAAGGRLSVVMPQPTRPSGTYSRLPTAVVQSPMDSGADDDVHGFSGGQGDAFSELDESDLIIPTRQYWKIPAFGVLAAGVALGGLLLFGWRPPLAWRQSSLWQTLNLPGAEAARASVSNPMPPTPPIAQPAPLPTPAPAPAAPSVVAPPAPSPATAVVGGAPAVPLPTATAIPTDSPPKVAQPAAVATVAVAAAPAPAPAAAPDSTVPATPRATRKSGGRKSNVPLAGMIWSETEQRLVPIGGTREGSAPPPPSSPRLSPPPSSSPPASIAPPPTAISPPPP